MDHQTQSIAINNTCNHAFIAANALPTYHHISTTSTHKTDASPRPHRISTLPPHQHTRHHHINTCVNTT
eukprot:475004-Amorphochlora_amoeboformis.AAC.2